MTTIPDRSAERIAASVAIAMARMSVADLGALYAEDIVIWHNYDGNTQSKSENLAFLGKLFSHCQSVSYVDIDRQVTERGYVQQHNLKVEMKDGRTASIPCCHIVHIANGHIRRFDEYLDPAPMYRLMAEQP